MLLRSFFCLKNRDPAAPVELSHAAGKFNPALILRSRRSRRCHGKQRFFRGGDIIKVETLYDNLTGLANRALFDDHFDLERAQAYRNRTKIALICLSVDEFGPIREALGREAGDILLTQIAGRFKACVRGSDTVARIAGGEFSILLTDLTDPQYAAVIIKKIKSCLRPTFFIGERTVNVTVSAGISIYPDDGKDIETLLTSAGTARRRAEERGRNNYEFSSAAVNARSLERVRLESELQDAIDRGELRLYYQPLIDVDTGGLVCTEALLRWQHPDLGLLRPEHFMPIAEETGLVLRIGEWTLRAACEQNGAWQAAGHPPFCVSINLSGRQFRQQDFAEKTLLILEESGLDPRWLELEITETTAMGDVHFSISSMRTLTDRGVKFSLDNFGTGCSSLNFLRQLPISKIKIDRIFIEDIPHDPNDRAIVRAMIAMSHSLRLKAVAQGVETEEQLAFLRANHCDEIQGHLIRPPLPLAKFGEVLETYRYPR